MKSINEKKRTALSSFVRYYERPRGFGIGGAADPTLYPKTIKNMYIDYEGGGDALESVPGFRRIHSFAGAVHSIIPMTLSGGEDCLFVHAGNGLYRFSRNERDTLLDLAPIAEMSDGKSYCLHCGTMAFLLDGEKLIRINGSGEPETLSENKKIVGCRTLALFDGRLFFSGNPDLPGEIFYSSRIDEENIAFPEEGQIKDSTCGIPISSLLSLGDGLWVFMADDGGEGGIICHSATKGSDGKDEYPISRIFSGVCARGGAMAYLDEILFVSSDGLSAIERPRSDDCRIVLRSKSILPSLLSEKLSGAVLGIWQGYVTLSSQGRIYLADTRGGVINGDLEWYLIDGVGGYRNDRRIYRYSPMAKEGYDLFPETDTEAGGEIISLTDEDGESIYYEKRGGKKYLVYPTEEYTGGDFYPASVLLCHEGLMWFGTESGELFLFNNDKRAEPPESLKVSEEFDREEFRRLNQGKIHPDFYAFGSHASEYLVEYYPDGCGFDGQTKSTVSGSLAICCKTFSRSRLSFSVLADGKEVLNREISPTVFGFNELSFGDMPASACDEVCVRLPERAVGWRKKQLIVSGKGFRAPIGIKSIGYRYKICKEKG